MFPQLMLLVTSSALATARLMPTAPGPGDSFAAGSACNIMWEADTTGTWTNVYIYLMTGSNSNMTRLTTVTSGLDGTDGDLSPFQWTCPLVQPHSSIYFYQFTDGDAVQDSTWTARFTISSPRGVTEPPQYDKQPNGDAVPWGEGGLESSNISPGVERPKAIPAAGLKNATVQGVRSGVLGPGPKGIGPSSGRATTTGSHKHVKSTSSEHPSGGTLPASYATASSSTATPTSRHPGIPSSESSEIVHPVVPTVKLPGKKPPVSHNSDSPSSTRRSGGPTVGPDVPDTGGMKLANAACINRDFFWLTSTPLYAWVIVIVVLI